MSKSWEDEHYDAWEKEDRRAKQEKHEELFWSEIEDGICPRTPVASSTVQQTPVDPKWQKMKDDLDKLIAEFKAKGRIT